MTTLEPGASVVFTQGLRARPASTAFLASRAAPTMTEGFDVFVHDVMAAMTTDPWSTDVRVPSSSVTSTGLDGRPSLASARGSRVPGASSPSSRSGTNGSEAGKVPAISSSSRSSCT